MLIGGFFAMPGITENAVTILRTLEEKGCTSPKHTLTTSQISDLTHLTRDDISEARDYLKKKSYILYSLESGHPMYLTPKGIDYLNEAMKERYSISINAENVLRSAVKNAPEVGLDASYPAIQEELKLEDKQMQDACTKLETFGLVKWSHYNVEPTIPGRKAVLRDFRDPSLVQAQSLARAINTGGGPYFEGSVETNGGDIVGRDQITNFDPQLLEVIFRRIDSSPHTDSDKEDLKGEVAEIIDEVKKGDDANESFISRRLRGIMRMAPDMFEVTVAYILNPVAGVAMTVKKIVEKAKAEASKAGQ
jgi:hypothetical protein